MTRSTASAETIPSDVQALVSTLAKKLAEPEFAIKFDGLVDDVRVCGRDRDYERLEQFILAEIVLPERERAS